MMFSINLDQNIYISIQYLIFMEIFYLNRELVEHFYYSPLYCQGVSVPLDGRKPVVIGMKHTWDPREPGYQRLDIPKENFEELLAAADKRDKELVDKVLLKHFIPKVKPKSAEKS